MQNALEIIKMAYLQVFNHSITLDVVYVACLVVLFYKKHEWKTGFYLIGLPAILAAVILLNPVYTYFYVKYVSPYYVEYSRQSWLLFTYIVIAYTAVKLFLSAKKKVGKIAILIFAMGVLLCQDYRGWNFYFGEPQNSYKLSGNAILAYEAIAKDSGIEENGELMKTGTQKNVVLWVEDGMIHADEMNADGELFYGLRMYTSDFVLSMRASELDDLESGKIQIADTFEPDGSGAPDYIIVLNDNHLLENYEQDGWRLAENIGSYLIYAKEE